MDHYRFIFINKNITNLLFVLFFGKRKDKEKKKRNTSLSHKTRKKQEKSSLWLCFLLSLTVCFISLFLLSLTRFG